MDITTESAPRYAGFGLRLLAFIIDNLIMSLFNQFLLFPVLMQYGIRFPKVESFQEMMEKAAENPGMSAFEIMGSSGGEVFTIFMATTLIEWLYFAGMESSARQATFGKLLFGIKVTDMQGQPVSFLKASGRYFSKLISRLTLFIGYIMAAFTEKKQALHDMMAGCLVVRKELGVRS